MQNVMTGSNDTTLGKRMIHLAPHFLVILGIALSFIDSRFLLIAIAGFFGPGLLAELGWLKSDEYQSETRLHASHHAFLLGGIFLALIVSFNGMGQRYSATMHQIDDAVPASLVLTLMLAVYYLSGLIRYWGPRKAAFRIISTFATLCLVFSLVVIFMHLKGPDEYPLGNLAQIVVFSFVMLAGAFLGRRHPRAAALLLVLPTGWIAMSGTLPWFQSNLVPWEMAMDVLLFTLLLPVTGIISFLVAGKSPEESQ